MELNTWTGLSIDSLECTVLTLNMNERNFLIFAVVFWSYLVVYSLFYSLSLLFSVFLYEYTQEFKLWSFVFDDNIRGLKIMSSQTNRQQCLFCSHINHFDRSFCQNCDSLLPNYFYLYQQNTARDRNDEETNASFRASFQKNYESCVGSTDFQVIQRSLYSPEWKYVGLQDKVERKEEEKKEELEFENNRVYDCPQCGNPKPFANPCPSCQYPLQLTKSSSVLISIREILSRRTKMGFQSLIKDGSLHLRSIATAGDLHSISEGAQAGLNPIVIPRRQHPSLYITSHYFQHVQSKEVRLFNNNQVEKGFYPLFDIRHYPYTYQSRVAAYMIPKDIRIGEVVVLEDIIDDFIGTLQPTPKRLESAPAIWDGARMVVLYSRHNDVADEPVLL